MADRLPAPNSQSSQDAHEDLMAALAASRELGPEMDATLVDRYLEKHGKSSAAIAQAQPPHGSPPVPYQALSAIGPILGIAAYIVILIVSQGTLWWTFWLPMALGGWWWSWPRHGGWDDPRNDMRQARRQARYEARNEYWARRYGRPYPYPPRNDEPQQTSTPSATSNARMPSDVL